MLSLQKIALQVFFQFFGAFVDYRSYSYLKNMLFRWYGRPQEHIQGSFMVSWEIVVRFYKFQSLFLQLLIKLFGTPCCFNFHIELARYVVLAKIVHLKLPRRQVFQQVVGWFHIHEYRVLTVQSNCYLTWLFLFSSFIQRCVDCITINIWLFVFLLEVGHDILLSFLSFSLHAKKNKKKKV